MQAFISLSNNIYKDDFLIAFAIKVKGKKKIVFLKKLFGNEGQELIKKRGGEKMWIKCWILLRFLSLFVIEVFRDQE